MEYMTISLAKKSSVFAFVSAWALVNESHLKEDISNSGALVAVDTILVERPARRPFKISSLSLWESEVRNVTGVGHNKLELMCPSIIDESYQTNYESQPWLIQRLISSFSYPFSSSDEIFSRYFPGFSSPFLSDPSPIIGYACHYLTDSLTAVHWLTD